MRGRIDGHDCSNSFILKEKWLHLLMLVGCLPPRNERFAVMCNSLDPSDAIVQDTGIL
jgi:hypothetical protein